MSDRYLKQYFYWKKSYTREHKPDNNACWIRNSIF